MSDSDVAPPRAAKPRAGEHRPTDPALYAEISGATVFVTSEPDENQRWISTLADLIDGLFAAHGSARPSDLVLDHAMRSLDADAAILTAPIDAERMEISNARGVRASSLVGLTFDRRSSIAGQVLDSGRTALIDMQHLRSPIEDVTAFGPMIITPLLGMRAVGTLGVTRMPDRPPLTSADLATVAGFASVATVALHVDEARSTREDERVIAERDRMATELLDSLVSRLFRIAIGIDRLSSAARDPDLARGLRQSTEQLDTVLAGIRHTIYSSRAPGRSDRLSI